jgi:hypothetical protein
MRSYGTPEYDKAAANLIAGKPDAEDRGHIAFQVGSVRGGAGAQSGMMSTSEARAAGMGYGGEITDRAASHYDSVGARYGSSTPTSAALAASDDTITRETANSLYNPSEIATLEANGHIRG